MNELEKYLEASKPKWYEWIPLVSVNYESRMNNYLREMPINDPTKKVIGDTYRKIALCTFLLPLVLSLVTPAMAMIGRCVVKRKLSK